jgi:hypothetical protein
VSAGVGIKVWEESGYEFVIIWGTFGYSGGLTTPTLDIDKLLNTAIPAVIEKTREKGGECKLLLGAGIVPRLFFLSVTRKLTTVRHSGLDSHSGQNPAIESIPDNDDTNQIKQIHIFSPLCFIPPMLAC